MQRVVIAELEKMCIVHLYTLGYRNEDLLSFKLTLNNPSKIAELQELEHLRTKFDIAGAATDGYFSKQWVYKNIFKLSDEEIQRIQVEQFTDAKHGGLIEAAGTAPEAGAEGGDLLGGEGEGDDLLGGDEGEAAPEGEEAAPEEAEEGPLLAEPGQRDDWYKPVTDPAWKQGARKRSYLSSAGNNIASSSQRNLFKGWSGELSPLSRGVVGEGLDREEKLLYETQVEIRDLIKQLEQKNESET